MARKSNPVKQTSITVQAPEAVREALEKMALELSNSRVFRGAEQGNVSQMIRLLLRFGLENVPALKEWLGDKVTEVVTEEVLVAARTMEGPQS